MATEHESNRSTALTSEAVGTMNVAIAAAVKEAVAAVFAGLGPMLHDMNKPYVDPAKAARDLRETQLWREDMEADRKRTQSYKDSCLHQDENQRSSIRLIRNFPDRQPRGICVKCHDLITPKEWRIGPPDKDNPRGRAYLAEPHKNYLQVLAIAARE